MRIAGSTKRWAAIAGCTVCMLLATAVGAQAAPILPLHTGDINDDGARDVADVSCYISATIANGQGLANPACQAYDDVDIDLQCNGSLDVTDVQRSILLALWTLSGDALFETLIRSQDLDFDLLHNDCDDDSDGDGYDNECEIANDSDPLDPSSVPADPTACGCPGGCIIDGLCLESGAVNAQNECLVCNPGSDPLDWSPLSQVPCDDGDLCTVGDQCVEGSCGGAPLNCSDGNVCTDDICDPAQGCINPANTAACDDGNACTANDTCSLAECGGSDIDCDDGDECTADSCDPATGCVNTNESCNDGIACTTDSCDPAGGCVFTPVNSVCDDGNACTDDVCNAVTGCTSSNNTAACDDGNACTGGDACSGGACAGSTIDCDDGDACTTDSCNPATGCQTTATTCSDDIACTTDSCDPASGCVFAPNNAACDDGNGCTDDACVPGSGCQTTNNTAPCDDGNACTQSDACSGGSCVGSNPVVCPSDLHPQCDMGSCDPATGLCSAADGTDCDDGDVCTVNDACSAGQCEATELPCDAAICVISGLSGETVECKLMMGRSQALDPEAVGMQFKLSYDESRVTLTTFNDGEVCFGPGACIPYDIPGTFGGLQSGHNMSLVPNTLAAWDLPGAARDALLINVSTPTPLTDAVIAPGGVVVSGDAVLMGIRFTLDVDVPADNPVIVDILDVFSTDTNALSLDTAIDGFVLVTSPTP